MSAAAKVISITPEIAKRRRRRERNKKRRQRARAKAGLASYRLGLLREVEVVNLLCSGRFIDPANADIHAHIEAALTQMVRVLIASTRGDITPG